MNKLITMAAACALLAGCASQSKLPSVQLSAAPGFEVSYSGGIGEPGNDLLDNLPVFSSEEHNEDAVVFTIETRIVELSAQAAEELFGTRAGGMVGAFSLDDAAIDAVTAAVEQRKDCRLLSAPRLAVFEGQTGTIQLTSEVAYISGYEIHAGKPVPKIEGSNSASRIADPVVSVMSDGMVLGLKVSDGAKLMLELDLTLAELARPIATQQIEVFGAPMTVQVPVLFTQRIKGSGAIEPGKVLALTGMVGSGQQVVLVLVSARQTEPADIPPGPAEPKKD
ncbi:MAG: hypothetical protein IPK87_01655 [Planctomycetes bacterium]|nr:hypothetical protein [Planctomycetota bacterium]